MRGPRTVVVAPKWVGDTVMALPTLDALAAAGRRVEVVARGHLSPLLELAPGVSKVYAGGNDREMLAALRQGFDEAVVLPNSYRSARLVRRAGIARRWGYRGNFRSWLLDPAIDRPGSDIPQIEDYATLLEAMGVAPPADWVPRLHLHPDGRRGGEELLRRAGIDPAAGPVVGLFPGAEFGPSKQWPRERFEQIARELRRRRPDVQLVLLAGPKEVWLGVRIHEETGKIHPVVGPDLDLGQLATVLGTLTTLVTNDSGPMHLAAAVGVPCVALFGPTDPARTAPAGEGHVVVSRERWCAPCFRRRCPLIHHRCLRDIGADEVADAVMAKLDG